MQRPWRRAFSIAAFGLSLACCATGVARTPAPASAPASAVAPAATAPARSAPEVLALRPYLHDGPLARAAAQFEAGQLAEAARLTEGALPRLSGAAVGDTARAGRALLALAIAGSGQPARGAALLLASAREWPAAADYLHAEAAKAFAAVAALDPARSAAEAVRLHSPWGRRTRLAVALAFERAGRRGEAIAILRPAVGQGTAAGAEAAARLADWLSADGQAAAAADLYWTIWSHWPTAREARGADARARAAAGAAGDTPPPPARALERGRRLFARHRNDDVIREMNALLPRLTADSAAWCEAHWLVARSHDKNRKRDRGAPHYALLTARCPQPALRADVLYYGGRSAQEAGRPNEALARFAALHTEQPQHSYNDDALLREARILRGLGRLDESRRALERALRDYPDGDMREFIGWQLVWNACLADDWAAVPELASRVLAVVGHERSFESAGRTLYWLGRALQRLGREPEAESSYVRCVNEYPLSYYSRLCAQRLDDRRRGLGQKTLRAAFKAARRVPDPLADPTPIEALSDPAWQTALELMRLGLREPARRALDGIADAMRTGRPDDWLRIWLFDALGDLTRSHQLARTARPAFERHYPGPTTERLWRLAYPRAEAERAERHARAAGLPPALVFAIMREESGFNPDVGSWAGAVGLMQLMPGTARGVAKDLGIRPLPDRTALTDPELNMRLGTTFLGNLLKRLQHPALAVAAYNAGAARVRGWRRERPGAELDAFVEQIPTDQTRGYTKRVLESFIRYRVLYEGREALPTFAWSLPPPTAP